MLSDLRPAEKRITPTIVREWEGGQPPKTTGELAVLCEVMLRNGVSHHELRLFRRAAMAACAGRQYPELFDHSDALLEGDVDEEADALWQREARRPCSLDIIRCMAFTRELDDVLFGESAGRCTPAQRRKQEVALAYCLDAQALYMAHAGRASSAASAYEAGAQLLDDRFGGGMGPVLSSARQRMLATYLLASDRRSLRDLEALLAMSNRAEGRGQPGAAALILLAVVGLAAEFGTPDLRSMLRPKAKGALDTVRDSGWPYEQVAMAELHLFGMALRDGMYADADAHAEGFQHWRSAGQWFQAEWACAMGDLALAKGDKAEGATHLERGLACAARAGHLGLRRRIEDTLQGGL